MKSCKPALASLLLGLGLTGPPMYAAEFGGLTAYYEDDGLLDITEWFDGNDYNPTDEAWWRWDDEGYNTGDAVTSSDLDSDWYGYTDNENDWYYDYYDPYVYGYYDYNDGLYDYGSHYYDYDDDGVYDAYLSYSDWDNDGVYEDYNYYAFNDTATDKQAQDAMKQADKQSKVVSVTGEVQQSKMVKVRDGGQHLVVQIKPTSGQQKGMLAVDLGPADTLGAKPEEGQTLTAMGPRAKVGDKTVLIARSVEMDGDKMQINRNTPDIQGKVLDTKTADVRGMEHQMAIVQTQQDGKTRKVAVDLGPADNLDLDLKKGDTLVFSGMPVKVDGRVLILAQSVGTLDNKVQIDRQPAKDGKKAAKSSYNN